MNCRQFQIIAMACVIPFLALAQDAKVGKTEYLELCSACHGDDAKRGELGPGILKRIVAHSDQELISIIHGGIGGRGMPAFARA